jgi:hypothetical protein
VFVVVVFVVVVVVVVFVGGAMAAALSALVAALLAAAAAALASEAAALASEAAAAAAFVASVLFWAGWHAVTQMVEIAAPTIMMLRSDVEVMFLVPLGEICQRHGVCRWRTCLYDAVGAPTAKLKRRSPTIVPSLWHL